MDPRSGIQNSHLHARRSTHGWAELNDEERALRSHDALLNRFLGYVVGALAGFLPLLEFVSVSDSAGRLLFPEWISAFFVAIGSLVTILLSGAALVSFRQAIALERQLGIEPAQVDPGLVRGPLTVRIVHRAYAASLNETGALADSLVDFGMVVVIVLVSLIDVTLPWPGIRFAFTTSGTGGTVVDFGEILAILLGVLAIALSVWVQVRDQYYYRRRAGPVEVSLTKFDVPQPNVLVHQYLLGGQMQQLEGVEIRFEWDLWNRVSWPVYFTCQLEMTQPGDRTGKPPLEGILFRDELMQSVGSALFVPPRQPVQRTGWVVWPRGVDGTITPTWMVRGKAWKPQRGPTKHVRWTDGLPVLSD
jgi:hypothetical protein